MKKRYKSLLLTNEWEIINAAADTEEHLVPCLPVVFAKSPAGEITGHFPYVLEDVDDDLSNVDEKYLDMIDARLCGYPLEILRTPRCIIREIRVDDVPKLYEIYSDKSITRYMEDLYDDMEEEKKYTEDYIKWHYGLYGFGMWIITGHDGSIIGRAGFDMKEEKEPYLGFMIRKDMQRQGLAYEVCMALMEYAKAAMDVPGIRSLTHFQNKAGTALLQKLGFTDTGFQDGLKSYYYSF